MKSKLSKPAKTAVLVVLVFLQLLGSRADEGSIRRSKVLDPRYHINWEIDGSGSKIIFNITAETKGYVGFGLSTNGAMSKADIVIGGVRDGTPYLNDYHGPSVGNGMPTLDKHNDYHLIDAWENETHTYLAFVRALETCDSADIPITKSGLKVIWSLGTSDDIKKHSRNDRGAITVYFLDPEQPIPDLSKFNTYNVTNTMTVLGQRTTYWCRIHRLPEHLHGRHMVAYKPYFEPEEDYKLVHHMLMYACPESRRNDPSYSDDWETQGNVECYKDWVYKPSSTYGPCQRIEYGWALGGEDMGVPLLARAAYGRGFRIMINPPQVGFPLQGGQYYRLEIHLDNQESKVQRNEITAGFTIYYTDKPRPINGSLIEIKAIVSEKLMIPPNSAGFTIAVHCTANCTDQSKIPSEGITVYGAFLHAHLSGRAIRVRHFRGNKELPWIINDENYDFNYQSHRTLPENVTIRAGDQLTAECTYDTRWKEGKAVIGGPATSDEMCMVVLSYYPAVEGFVKCDDLLITQENFENFLNITYVGGAPRYKYPNVTDPKVYDNWTGREMSFSEAVEGFNWTEDKRKEYQELERYGRHSVYCNFNGSIAKSVPVNLSYPEHLEVYTEPERAFCSGSKFGREVFKLKESSGRQLVSGSVFFPTITFGVYLIVKSTLF